MSAYRQFIFDSYTFNRDTGELDLHYAFDDAMHFTEKYKFDFPVGEYNQAAFDRAVQGLFFIAGVSYYKRFLPPEIVVRSGHIDAPTAAFLSKTYQRGLGEFWFVNKLDPRTPVHFPVTAETPLSPIEYAGQGLLTAVGGGKDSLVTIELLRSQGADISTWSVDHKSQLEPLVERIGSSHFWVERTWDPQLLELKGKGFSGHVPISAIFACVGVLVAILNGHRDVVMSNEQSANEPTLHYQGVAINHQYSKSEEFERDFQQYLQHHFGDALRYYSFLRPLSEVRIAEIFAQSGAFEKYKDAFSSCNRAFVHTSDHMFWCGECPKCAFIFMALTPFVPKEELTALWGGKNLLLDPQLEPMYKQLLGIEGDKPLDCVGEVKESREAMHLAEQMYPELRGKYTYELPDSYDFRALGTHEMPEEIYKLFTQALAALPPAGERRG